MGVYEDTVQTWWKYIDAILLKVLPAPIPFIKSIEIECHNDSDGEPTEQFLFGTYHYAANAKTEKRLEAKVRMFLVTPPGDSVHYASEITGRESDKNVQLAYGHYEMYQDFECLFTDIQDCEIKFLNQVYNMYLDFNMYTMLHEAIPQFSVCNKYEKEIAAITNDAEKKYVELYGIGDLQFQAKGIVQGYWKSLYEDLGLLEEGAAYDLLTQGTQYVIDHHASKHNTENRVFSPEKYYRVYGFYLEYIFSYLQIMRPVIHQRLMTYTMRCTIEDGLTDEKLQKRTITNLLQLYNKSSSSECMIYIRRPKDELNNFVEILKEAMFSTDKEKVKIRCPWAIYLTRFKL